VVEGRIVYHEGRAAGIDGDRAVHEAARREGRSRGDSGSIGAGAGRWSADGTPATLTGDCHRPTMCLRRRHSRMRSSVPDVSRRSDGAAPCRHPPPIAGPRRVRPPLPHPDHGIRPRHRHEPPRAWRTADGRRARRRRGGEGRHD
jgi:hypothetical protein